MKKNTALIVSIALLFFSIGLLSWVVFSPKPVSYSFRIEYEEIVFLSNEGKPASLLKNLSTQKTFLISPVVEENQEDLSEVTDVITVFQAVLTASDKNAVTLIRELDSGGKITKCFSNLGDTHENQELTAKECQSLLEEDGESTVKILVELDNDSLQKSEVIIEGKKIIVSPNPSHMEPSRISVVMLKSMFADTQSIIDFINNFTT